MLSLTGHQGRIYALCYSPNGQRLVSVGQDQRVHLWQPPQSDRVFHGHGSPIRAVTFLGDSHTLVTGDERGELRLWDLGANTCRQLPSRGARPISGLQYLKGAYPLVLATGLADRDELTGGTIELLQIEPGGRSQKVFTDRYPIRRLAAHPDRKLLAWCNNNRKVQVRDLTRSDPKEYPQAKPVNALALAPDGSTMLVAVDYQVKVIDLGRGHERLSLQGHKGLVKAVAYHPSGQWVASAGWDQTVRLWELATGREVASFAWSIGQQDCLAFAPDGMSAAVAGASGEIRLWDIDVY